MARSTLCICIMLMVAARSYSENPCHIEGYDMVGYDIRNLKTDDLSACRRECARDSRLVYT